MLPFFVYNVQGINAYCRYGSVGVGVGGGAAEDAGYDYAAGPAEGASSSTSAAAAASTTAAPESQDYSYAGEEEGGDYAEDDEPEKATTTTVALPHKQRKESYILGIIFFHSIIDNRKAKHKEEGWVPLAASDEGGGKSWKTGTLYYANSFIS